MSVRSILFAATATLALSGAAHADNARPLQAKSIDLGEIAGVAYYTVEPDGFRVVTTLTQGETGIPLRVVAILAPGQSLVLSTPREEGTVEISRQADTVLVRKTPRLTN